MVHKAFLAIALSLLLPVANLKAQVVLSETCPESPYMHSQPTSTGIAYETGIGTSKLVATILLGTIGVAIVAIALFNTNYCYGHHHQKSSNSSTTSKHPKQHSHYGH